MEYSAPASTRTMSVVPQVSPTPSVAIPGVTLRATRSAVTDGRHPIPLLTPPNSLSPDLSFRPVLTTPEHGPDPILRASRLPSDVEPRATDATHHEIQHEDETLVMAPALPLSKGALCGLDAAAAITPTMLARHHLPGIMLGNGPRPIRYVLGELTQSVPGFSRIPSAKARRLVVAALETRQGGGVDGSVTFYKTGWGKWDAHVKGSSRDSAIGSFNEGRFSPSRSEHSYAVSYTGSVAHAPGPRVPSGYREQLSGGSWTASSIREEDEHGMDVDMDVPEHEADKMSLDGVSEHAGDESDDSLEMDDATDDEEDWAAVGPEALRKAALPVHVGPRLNYNAFSSSCSARWTSRNFHRRQSGWSDRRGQSASLPQFCQLGAAMSSAATPGEKAAIAALMSLGST